MLVKQEFKVDLIDLKNAKDAEGVLELIKQDMARKFGYELCLKLFPYIKNEEKSFQGTLPDACLNREHQYTDHYEQRLLIMSEAEAAWLSKLINRSNSSQEDIFTARKILSS